MTETKPTPSSAPPSTAVRPSLRARGARRPPGPGLYVGAALLGVYLVAAVSALVVFRQTLTILPTYRPWVPPFTPVGPSWAHPFGVMPGMGTGIFRAIWQATPWDLSIVASILALDATLGLLLGAVAGMHEGGRVDAVVTFVGDSFGSIPAVFWVILLFAILTIAIPVGSDIPVFILLFGVILWPTTARAVREQARLVSHEKYVESARASGATSRRVLVSHIIPNSLSPLLAQIPVDVAPIFFVLTVFPWFDNCVNRPQSPFASPYLTPLLPRFSPLPSVTFPEWGYLLGFGTCEGFSFPGGFSYWWMYLFPLMAIVGLGLAIGLVCDGIDQWRRLGR